ncbi:MAG: hypothetical protein KGS46_11135, partial [Chloroflexi bacterium]|nr:hypothetical protein [Chloroflexota bacterium]
TISVCHMAHRNSDFGENFLSFNIAKILTLIKVAQQIVRLSNQYFLWLLKQLNPAPKAQNPLLPQLLHPI